jgi:hypothetical protein
MHRGIPAQPHACAADVSCSRADAQLAVANV